MYRILISFLFLASIFGMLPATSQGQVLSDSNGNGSIALVAVGDSVTAGLGDGIPPGVYVDTFSGTEFGEAYAGRLTRYLGVPVKNEGIPGERFLGNGIARFPSEVSNSTFDGAILFEGLNDTLARNSAGEFGRALQRAANVARSLHRSLVVVTLPDPCCNHAGRTPFIDAYNGEIRNVARINDFAFADVARAWDTTCQNKEECELFNLPDGLHPNSLGHDVIAQTIAASILNIDIFSPGGAQALASAIGLAPSDIKVKPDVVSPSGNPS